MTMMTALGADVGPMLLLFVGLAMILFDEARQLRGEIDGG